MKLLDPQIRHHKLLCYTVTPRVTTYLSTRFMNTRINSNKMGVVAIPVEMTAILGGGFELLLIGINVFFFYLQKVKLTEKQ